MYEEYRKDILLALADILGDNSELFMLTLSAIDTVSNKYSIEKKSLELVPVSALISETIKLYLATMSVEGRSKGTISNRYYVLRRFFDTVQLPIDLVQTNDIRAYLYTIKETTSADNAENNRIILNSFFEFCIDEGIIATNPCRKIRHIKCSKVQIKPLSEDELILLFECCETEYELALVSFMYSTGARISEVSGVKISDLDFTKKKVLLFGKGSKERYSNLSDKAIKDIKAYLKTRSDTCPYLFPSEKRNPKDRITAKSLRDVIHKIAGRCGLDINPHQIRHTTATNLQKEMPIQQISKYLGHANISTTMIYAEINTEELDENFDKVMNKVGA